MVGTIVDYNKLCVKFELSSSKAFFPEIHIRKDLWVDSISFQIEG